MKKPWEQFPHIWKTEAAFIAYIRGGVRRSIWSRYPVKIEFMKASRKRVHNPKTGNEVWGGTCYLCSKDFPQAMLEVDHIVGNHKFTKLPELGTYLQNLLYIDFDDMAFACKPCHKIKSYSEKMGIPFKQAVIEKEIIAFMKLTVAKQTSTLTAAGYSKADISNAQNRKAAYRSILIYEDSK